MEDTFDAVSLSKLAQYRAATAARKVRFRVQATVLKCMLSKAQSHDI